MTSALIFRSFLRSIADRMLSMTECRNCLVAHQRSHGHKRGGGKQVKILGSREDGESVELKLR